jgi:hypothetical protein
LLAEAIGRPCYKNDLTSVILIHFISYHAGHYITSERSLHLSRKRVFTTCW